MSEEIIDVEGVEIEEIIDAEIIGENDSNFQGEPVENKKFSMWWYKFQIYFSLWWSTFLYFRGATLFFSGKIYGDSPDYLYRKKYVYQMLPYLEYVDYFCGLFMLMMSCYLIYVRFQLSYFNKNAPKKLLLYYLIDFVSMTMYQLFLLMAISSVNSSSSIIAQNVGNVIGSIIGYAIVDLLLFLINDEYYGHRKDLFVH